MTKTRSFRRWSFDYLYEGSVDEKTRQTYESRLNTMRNRGLPLTYEGLRTMISMQDGAKSVSLKVTRSAINWHLQRTGQPGLTEAQKGDIAALLRGRRRAMAETPAKGAIDRELLDDLLTYMRTPAAGCSPEDRRNIIIAWGTALRSGQMKVLRRKHFIRMTDGSWGLRIEANHYPHRTAHRPRLQTAAVHPDIVQQLDRYLPTLDSDDLICPEWNATRYNKIIKAAAVDMVWPEHLSWKGVHQLRHGVAVDLARQQGLDAAQEIMRHRKPQRVGAVTRNYARENSARQQKKPSKTSSRRKRAKKA